MSDVAGQLVDSHCHLDFDALQEQGLDTIMERARLNGVIQCLTISTRTREIQKLLDITEKYNNVHCTVGVHPHNVAEEIETDITTDKLLDIAKNPNVVGIGESGLDYHYDYAPANVQDRLFREHIRASQQSGLPLVIHAREADKDIIKILYEEIKEGGEFPGILHCFSSGAELAEYGLEVGLHISFSGILTFKSAQEIRDIAKNVPLDRLLVETDAPYLAPTPYRGKTNEPAYVAHTARKLAEVKGVSEAELAKTTTDNFFKLFSKIDR